MKRFLFSLPFLIVSLASASDPFEEVREPLIYLLPGTGADCRLFKRIDFPYDTVHLEFPSPERKMDLRDYALDFIPRIDTSRRFILVGVSLGGMISTELADTISPERVIVISGAKERKELPHRYRFQKYLPLNQLAPKGLVYWGAKNVAPLVEKELKSDPLFDEMIEAKDPHYLKWTVNMIIDWKRKGYDSSIVHIHGGRDHTIPARGVDYDYLIAGGTHMMVYFRAEEISSLIKKILLE